MKAMQKFELKRVLWYIAGLLLFFAPFAYYEKTLSLFLSNWTTISFADSFHSACLRMPINSILTGKGVKIVSLSFISLVLVLGVAFWVGPYFCGRFCFAGALSEYLSRIVPKRLQINWQEAVPPVPIRYGFFLGFLISPFLGASISCSYCSFSLTEMISTGIKGGDLGTLSSITIITAFLWLILFGAFARGGRGFCTYMCPVGAAQNVFHAIGVRFNFTHKICIASEKCVSCGLCAKKCPTGSIQVQNKEKPSYQIYTCITCRSCVATCPNHALRFSSGNPGWTTKEKGELATGDLALTSGGER